ncbi:hypothetical protein LEMLEM_LOCUS14720 [Lemmus lemmus]
MPKRPRSQRHHLLHPHDGLVNPKGLCAPALRQVGPSKRPAPLRCSLAVPVKRLLGEKPSLLAPLSGE